MVLVHRSQGSRRLSRKQRNEVRDRATSRIGMQPEHLANDLVDWSVRGTAPRRVER